MPDWKPRLRARLRRLTLDPAVEADIVEELAGDLDDRYRELLARGLDPDAAERTVETTHLSDDAVADAIGSTVRRAAPPAPALGLEATSRRANWGLDLRYAFRSLLKAPGLTTVVLSTLAIGVGANIAIFSVVNALLLRPPPFQRPDELVAFWGSAPDKGLPIYAYPDVFYDLYHRRLRSLDPIAMYSTTGVTLTGTGDAIRVDAAYVTSDFFRLFGATPQAGRTFAAEEETRGKGNVAVLGYALWHRRFGGDPAVIGRAITVSGTPMTIVGVMPARFDFPERVDLWAPLEIDPQSMDCWCYRAFGRLRPGVAPADVVRDVEALNAAFWTEREPGRVRPPRKPGAPPGTVVMPLRRLLAGEMRTPALVLLAAVGMVLLIACANLANLALARAAGRRREIAVRAALGASPRRIARQLLVESLLVSVTGTAIGLGLAWLAIRAVERAWAANQGPLTTIPFDLTVLGFAVLIGVGSGLAFGVLPAVRGARIELAPALRDGQRGTGDAPNRRLNDVFVVTQLALSLILLIGAGLLLRSFSRLMAVDLGFRTENVLVGRIGLPGTLYRPPAIRIFIDRVLESVGAMPGVKASAVSSNAPFSAGNDQQEVYVEGREVRPGEPIPVTSVRSVTTGYFDAIGTPLLSGRPFGPADRDSSRPVVIVDESLAHRYWPDRSPLGARLALGREPNGQTEWRTVVGVAKSIHHRRVDQAPDHYVYKPIAQAAGPQFDLVIRAAGDQTALATALQTVVKSVDPNVPLYDVHPLAEAVDRSLAERRLTNLLLAAFAGAALLLALIGIYGVMARSVGARTREFGVRLALGASAAEVRRMVLREAVTLVGIGAASGLAGAVLITRLLRGLLFGVDPFDPATFALAAAGLGAVALAACYFPARRATRADPLVALRTD
jgi:predicted permease